MTYFVLTIDVEPDCSPTWDYSDPLSFYGVKVGIKELLQPLFNKYGIIPTYLINNVVLEDYESVEVFKSLKGEFELGTHLHPEFIEPQKTVFKYAGSKGSANCCFYEPEVEFKKLENLTDLFLKDFGYRPFSFRAGRFSAGINTIDSLSKLGYKVDTSVTPNICWNDSSRQFPINYKQAYEQPYFIKRGSYLDRDYSGEILEVPISICKLRNNILKEYFFSIAGLRRTINHLRPVWLRPVYSSFNDFSKVVDYFKRQYGDENHIILNMMFHNVEIIPNLSPYTKNEYECDNYLNQLECFFRYCNQHSIQSINLLQLYDLYKKK